MSSRGRRRAGFALLAGSAIAALIGAAALAQTSYSSSDGWWSPGSGDVFAANGSYPNALGKVGIINGDGMVPTKGHPFFEPIGSNGRACVSCHQPGNAMSLSVETIQKRWDATHGKDPLFAAVDGSNCPAAPQDAESSHSLLLKYGLFRVSLPWPPKPTASGALKPEFDIQVVSDPTGCNLDPVYGFRSASPHISVFRRPRVVANFKFVMNGGGSPFNIKDGTPMERDPDTGRFVNMDIMADARAPTLKLQAIDAAMTHLEARAAPTAEQLKQITAFESQLSMASSQSAQGGDLTAKGSPEGLGPAAMRDTDPGLGDNYYSPVFGYFDQWKTEKPDNAQAAFRASVARGMEIYLSRTFYIRDVTHLNTIGLGNPIKRTCSTCHNARMTGMDAAPGWMDLGTGNRPWSDALASTAELPLFKLTCHADAKPHPFLGPVIFTHDPGRALISGRCVDIGAITMQQFRGLSARAPYFSNGSAKTLRDLVEYYNKRFDINYTDQEKEDLVNFLSVL